MTDEVSGEGLTVVEAKAKSFMELVDNGEDPKKAADKVGTTLRELKRSGALASVCKELVKRAQDSKLLDKKVRENVAKARLVELMVQDEDLKVALGAVKTELEVGRPFAAVQINNNLITDPAVIESLKTLQLEVEGETEKSED